MRLPFVRPMPEWTEYASNRALVDGIRTFVFDRIASAGFQSRLGRGPLKFEPIPQEPQCPSR